MPTLVAQPCRSIAGPEPANCGSSENCRIAPSSPPFEQKTSLVPSPSMESGPCNSTGSGLTTQSSMMSEMQLGPVGPSGSVLTDESEQTDDVLRNAVNVSEVDINVTIENDSNLQCNQPDNAIEELTVFCFPPAGEDDYETSQVAVSAGRNCTVAEVLRSFLTITGKEPVDNTGLHQLFVVRFGGTVLSLDVTLESAGIHGDAVLRIDYRIEPINEARAFGEGMVIQDSILLLPDTSQVPGEWLSEDIFACAPSPFGPGTWIAMFNDVGVCTALFEHADPDRWGASAAHKMGFVREIRHGETYFELETYLDA